MKRGFTLIELLAVIVILAIIALIATPIILGIINNTSLQSKERTSELIGDSIVNAYSTYAMSDLKYNPDSFCSYMDSKYFAMDNITNLNCSEKTATMTSGGVKYTAVYKNGQVTITHEGSDYKTIVKIGEVIEYYVCSDKNFRAAAPKDADVEEQFKVTTGNVPKGKYNIGDEYVINVDGSHWYHFFVISNTSDKVTLIANKSLAFDGSGLLTDDYENNTVVYMSDEDFKAAGGNMANVSSDRSIYGPITATNKIREATKNWKNLDKIERNYTDINYYTTVQVDISNIAINGYARMANVVDYSNMGCPSAGGDTSKCPNFAKNISNNLLSNIPGSKNSAGIFYSDGYTYYTSSNSPTNIIPIIEISKSKMSNCLIEVKQNSQPICKPATNLHKMTCDSSNCDFISGYSSGDVMTFGTIPNGELNPGDAYTCDVNGDGNYNEENERFYYVSTTEQGKISLIYYKNYTTSDVEWDDVNDTTTGPVTAAQYLPTQSEWKNVPLIGKSYIKHYDDKWEFDYEDKVARLPLDEDSLSASFAYENISNGYYVGSLVTYHSLNMPGSFSFYGGTGFSFDRYGVRPVIEIEESDINLK